MRGEAGRVDDVAVREGMGFGQYGQDRISPEEPLVDSAGCGLPVMGVVEGHGEVEVAAQQSFVTGGGFQLSEGDPYSGMVDAEPAERWWNSLTGPLGWRTDR